MSGSHASAMEEGKEMEVFLPPQDIEIKEVVVKAPRVRLQGDTIKYDVQLYSKEGDRAIGDVLKRLPGIKTSEDGKISYNGVPINRFYIENSNLLGTQYGIATNNIPQKDVASVEVMQNHQPIKVLEGLVFSDQAAINLRLKSGARMKWIGTLKAAGGRYRRRGRTVEWRRNGHAFQQRVSNLEYPEIK